MIHHTAATTSKHHQPCLLTSNRAFHHSLFCSFLKSCLASSATSKLRIRKHDPMIEGRNDAENAKVEGTTVNSGGATVHSEGRTQMMRKVRP